MSANRQPTADLETIMPLLIGIWRRLHKESGPQDRLQTREFRRVVQAIQEMPQKEDPFSDPEQLGAYLLYHWVLHYQQGLSLINELPIKPKRVLDLCSGPAAFSLAALRHGAKEVIAVDKSMQALEMGAHVCGRYGYPLSVRQADVKKPWRVEGNFDLIVLGYALEELFPENEEAQQTRFIENALKRLTPDGFLLLVEDSRPVQNSRLLRLRDELVRKGTPVQAPCIWQGDCPALQTQNSPCYAQREFEKPYLIKELQRAANINLNSLKMSYVIFKNPLAGWPKLPEEKLYRVISPPVDEQTGRIFYLCGQDGKKRLRSRFPEQPKEARAFDYLKRGELISVSDAVDSGPSLDIGQTTKVKVEAACGKPLPGNLGEENEY